MTLQTNSPKLIHGLSHWSIAAIAAFVFVCGLVWQNASLLGVGAAISCLVLYRVGTDDAPAIPGAAQNDGGRREEARVPSDRPSIGDRPRVVEPPQRNIAPRTTDALVDELLANGRYALLLRPETKQHLTQFQVMRAIRQLDEAMALVPEGRVLIGQLA